jgi:hypothetical protein
MSDQRTARLRALLAQPPSERLIPVRHMRTVAIAGLALLIAVVLARYYLHG